MISIASVSLRVIVVIVGVLLACSYYAEGDRYHQEITSRTLATTAAEEEDDRVPPIRRALAAGDWDSLNDLLKDVIFAIPDPGTFTAGTFAWTDLKVTLSSIRVSKSSLTDMTLTSSVPESSTERVVSVEFQLSGLAATVNLDWAYKYGIISGSGTADATVKNGDAVVKMTVTAASAAVPPTEATVDSCSMSLDLDATYSGGITAAIADLFKSSVNKKIQGVIEDEVCTELKSAGQNDLNAILSNVSSLVNPYLAPAPAPLPPEEVLEDLVPNATQREGLLNLQDHWSVRFVEDVLTEVFEARDADGELGINTFISGVTAGGNVSIQPAAVLYNSSDMLTSTVIVLSEITISGLNTFTVADLLTVSAPQVATSDVAIDTIGYNISMTLNIQPSTAKGAVVQGGSGEIVENIRIYGEIEKLALNATGILAIDNATLNAITLGQLVSGGNAGACIGGAFVAGNVTGAESSLGSISRPTLSHFISVGLSKLLNSAVGAGMDMYLETLEEALPSFVQEYVRMEANAAIGAAIVAAHGGNGTCTYPNHTDGHWQAWENVTLGNLLLPLDVDALEPLDAERALLRDPAPADRDLVNWTTNWFTFFANDYTRSFLAKEMPEEELGINRIVRGLFEDLDSGEMLFLSDAASMLFNISNPLMHETYFSVSIDDLKARGLDTITAFDATTVVAGGSDLTLQTRVALSNVTLTGIFSFSTLSLPCPTVCWDKNAGKTQGCPASFTNASESTVPGQVYVVWTCDSGGSTCTIASASTSFYMATSACPLTSLLKPSDHDDCLKSLGSGYSCLSEAKDGVAKNTTVSGVTMSFGLPDVDLIVDTLVAVDESLEMNTPFGALYDSPVECIASLIVSGRNAPYPAGLNISVANVSVGLLTSPPVSGFPSDDENQALGQMLDVVRIFFRDILRDALPSFLQNLVRPLLNDKLVEVLFDGAWSGPFEQVCPPMKTSDAWPRLRNATLGDVLVLPPTEQDPLSAEAEIRAGTYPGIPSADELDDFLSDDLFLFLEKMNARFFSGTNSAGECRANDLVRDFTSGTGNLTIDLDDGAWILRNASSPLLLGGASVSARVDFVEISKLDTFAFLEPLGAIASHTARSSLGIREVEVAIGLLVEVSPPSSSPRLERVRLRAELSEVNATVAAMFAVNRSALYALTVGSLAQSPLACLESVLMAAEATEVVASLGSLRTYDDEVWGSLAYLGEAVDGILEGIQLAAEDVVLPHMVQMSERVLRPALNDFLDARIPSGDCPSLNANATSLQRVTWGSIVSAAPTQNPLDAETRVLDGTYVYAKSAPSSYRELVNLTASPGASPFADLAQNLVRILEDYFGGDRTARNDDALKIDSIVDGLTDGSGNVTVAVETSIVDGIRTPLMDGANVSVWLHDIKLSGLDSFVRFDPLVMLSSFTLETRLDAHEIDVVFNLTVNASGTDASPLPTSDGFLITATLRDLVVDIAAMVAIDEADLGATELGSVLADPLACLSDPVLGLDLTRLKLTVGNSSRFDVVALVEDDDSRVADAIVDIVDAAQIALDQLVLPHLESVASQLVQPALNTAIRRSLRVDSECPVCTTACVSFEDLVSPVDDENDPLDGERMLFACLYPDAASRDPSLLPAGLTNLSRLPKDCNLPEVAAFDGSIVGDVLDISQSGAMPFVQSLLDEYVRGYESKNSSELKINALMRKLMKAGNGSSSPALTVSLGGAAIVENLTTPLMNGRAVSVYLDELVLRHLDSFTTFDPLRMLSNHTIEIAVSMSSLDVDLSVRVEVDTSETYAFIVETGLRDVVIDVAALLAANASSVRALTLGGLLQTPIDCLGEAMIAAEISKLDITAGSVLPPNVSSTRSSGSGDFEFAIGSLLAASVDVLDSMVLPNLRSVGQRLVLPAINLYAAKALRTSRENGTCPLPTRGVDAPPAIDFRSSGVLSLAQKIIRSVVGTNATGLDKIVDSATKGQSGLAGMLAFPGPFFNFSTHFNFVDPMSGYKEDMGQLSGALFELLVLGIDSISQFDLLAEEKGGAASAEGEDPAHTLRTALTIGSIARGGPLSALVRLLYSVVGGKDRLHVLDDVRLGLNMTSARVLLDLAMYVSTERLLRMRMDQFEYAQCWLSTLDPNLASNYSGDAISVPSMEVSFSQIGLSVDCVPDGEGCTGPSWQTFADNCRDPDKVAQATAAIDRGMSWVSERVATNVGGSLFADLVSNAPSKCCDASKHSAPRADGDPVINDACSNIPSPAPPPPAPSPAPSPTVVEVVEGHLLIFWLCVGASALCVVLSVAWCVVRRKVHANKVVASYKKHCEASSESCAEEAGGEGLLMSSARRLSALAVHINEDWIVVQAPKEYDDGKLAKELGGPSLFNHPRTPVIAKWGVPVVLVGTMGMFLSGHVQDGAHVMIDIDVAGESIFKEWQVFSFSLGSSLGDMYNAGAYVLVFLIGGMSGAWPYTKCLMLLYSWFAPPWLFRPRQRGQTLQILDMLGKWSLIDVYVLLLCQCAFRVTVKSPEHGFDVVPENFYDVEVMVLPVWGMFAFLLATCSALITNHFAIIVHRNVIAEDTSLMEAYGRLENVDVAMRESGGGGGGGGGGGMGLPSVDALERIDSLPDHHFDDDSMKRLPALPPTPSSPLKVIAETRCSSEDVSVSSSASSQFSTHVQYMPPSADGSAEASRTRHASSPPDGLSEIKREPSRTRCASSLAKAMERLRDINSNADMSPSSSSSYVTRRRRRMTLRDARRRLSSAAAANWERGRATSYFDAGTKDVRGSRAVLVGLREALKDHIFDVDGEDYQVVLSARAQLVVLTLCLGSALMILVGAFLPTFVIDVAGLAGIAENLYEPDTNVKYYSLWRIAQEVFEQATFCHHLTDQIGVGFMGVVYLLVSLVFPFAQLCSLAVLWHYPMTLKTQKQFFFANEVLSAWSTVEVFLVGIIAALFELTSVSGFMADAIDQCADIKKYLHEYAVPLELMTVDQAQCFSVLTRLSWGVYVLIAAAFLANIACQIVLRLAEAALEAREDRIKGRKVEEELANGCGRYLVTRFNGAFNCCLVRIPRNTDTMSEHANREIRRRTRKFSSQNRQVVPPHRSGHDLRRWTTGGSSVESSSKEDERKEEESTPSSSLGEDNCDLLVKQSTTTGSGLAPPLVNVSVRGDDAIRSLPPQWTAILASRTSGAASMFWNQSTGETITVGESTASAQAVPMGSALPVETKRRARSPSKTELTRMSSDLSEPLLEERPTQ